MTVVERTLLAECKRRGEKLNKATAIRKEELEALRGLWLQARQLGIRSETIAAASGVSPATVRMVWMKGD